jgi:hypothetical protein
MKDVRECLIHWPFSSERMKAGEYIITAGGGGGEGDKEKGKIIENSGENFLSQDLPPYLK